MRKTRFIGLVALSLLGSSSAFAQSASSGVTGTVRATPAVPAPLVTPTVPAEPPVLFSIGNVPVRVWAPVPPPYDSTANGTGAANPIQNQPDWWATGSVPG